MLDTTKESYPTSTHAKNPTPQVPMPGPNSINRLIKYPRQPFSLTMLFVLIMLAVPREAKKSRFELEENIHPRGENSAKWYPGGRLK